jgi:hypothetical protein
MLHSSNIVMRQSLKGGNKVHFILVCVRLAGCKMAGLEVHRFKH